MENDALSKDEQPIERRLATILMADVADYSRLMGENEERTVQVFRGHRQVFDELLRLHRGRIFNTAGDAVLAEFSSAVEAVRCATEIQAALHTRNEHLPAEQRMLFRIGINLGDVIVQGGDLLGDGVNVAARIQSIAEPGGICISGSVYDQIQNKLTLQFKQLGEQSFKNIARPVRTFSISDDRDEASPSSALPWGRTRKRRIVATTGALIALIASVGVASWLYRDYSQRAADEARRATEAQRVAEVQRKAEQDKAAAAKAQNEARLLSELQAAKDALTQAEASKRKTEQDRAAAEAAQREARLQAELRSVKDAQQRADAERKAAAETLRAAAAEATAAKAAVEAAAARAAAAAPQKAAAPPAVAVPSKPAGASAAGVDRFDGIYNGRLCNMFVKPETKTVCWPAALKVERGALLASWISGNMGKPAYARGKISPQGTVEVTLEAFTSKGDPASGLMTGTWSDNEISASGAWNGGLRVNATWKRAP
jgi:class 3 adenylate cyclase